ncbi:MAG TPA: DUF2911 domain-containing protein [Gemmatimonadales bacterium]
MPRTPIPMALAAMSLAITTAATAQIRASERGTVSQTVDGATITIDYGRPQLRGRTDLWGGEIWWGKVWTPGANWATTIDVSKDVTIDGHALATGSYSVWFEVKQDGWTAIFDPEPHRFHLMGPPPADNQVRFPIVPAEGPSTEVLTWSFPAVRPTGGTLQFAWGTTAVSFDLAVPASRDLTVTRGFADRYVGSYQLRPSGPLGETEGGFDISHANDRLVVRWEHPPDPNFAEFWLIHLGEGMFAPGQLKDGALFDIVTDLVFEFTPLEGKATGFELRALGDALWGTGTRAR